jgi:hypothetical protein
MLKFKIISDIKECKSLWNLFSPNNTLWDLWDFRYCFHNQNFDPYFIVGFENNQEVGLIPLVYDKKNEIYTYFGDTFPEQNKFFLKDKHKLPLFLMQCPEDTQIYYIDKSEREFYNFDVGEKRYFLDFKRYDKNVENYLKTFTKKHRKNLRYDLKKLKEKNYKIGINETKDFEKLVKFNKQKFGKESDYNDENFVESMKKLIETAQKMQMLHMISIQFNNKIEAVGLGVIYNKTYSVIGSGRNIEIENLGKLLIFEQIKSALQQNCDEIDFLSTEAGWKKLWNLDSEQMYEFMK